MTSVGQRRLLTGIVEQETAGRAVVRVGQDTLRTALADLLDPDRDLETLTIIGAVDDDEVELILQASEDQNVPVLQVKKSSGSVVASIDAAGTIVATMIDTTSNLVDGVNLVNLAATVASHTATLTTQAALIAANTSTIALNTAHRTGAAKHRSIAWFGTISGATVGRWWYGETESGENGDVNVFAFPVPLDLTVVSIAMSQRTNLPASGTQGYKVSIEVYEDGSPYHSNGHQYTSSTSTIEVASVSTQPHVLAVDWDVDAGQSFLLRIDTDDATTLAPFYGKIGVGFEVR